MTQLLLKLYRLRVRATEADDGVHDSGQVIVYAVSQEDAIRQAQARLAESGGSYYVAAMDVVPFESGIVLSNLV